jgi:hypothetical protein
MQAVGASAGARRSACDPSAANWTAYGENAGPTSKFFENPALQAPRSWNFGRHPNSGQMRKRPLDAADRGCGLMLWWI